MIIKACSFLNISEIYCTVDGYSAVNRLPKENFCFQYACSIIFKTLSYVLQLRYSHGLKFCCLSGTL